MTETAQEKTIASIFGLTTKDQTEVFLRGFSAGMIAGGAATKAFHGFPPASGHELASQIREIIVANRNKQHYLLGNILSDDIIDALLMLLSHGNGGTFLNNIIS